MAYDESLYVIWAYCQYLQMRDFKLPSDIEVDHRFGHLAVPQTWISEWELELLAKEVILNGSSASQKRRTLRSWKVLSDTLNSLKKLEDGIYGLQTSNDTVLTEIVRIAHRQFIWQGNPPNSISAIRYYKIFNQDTIDRVCQSRLGISVKDIFLLGLMFLGVSLKRPTTLFPIQTDIKRVTPENLESFLSFTCRTIPELKALLKSEQRYDAKYAYAYNSLRAFPLVRMPYKGRDSIVCPLPTLLFWRITSGLYYELLSDSRFPQAFGESFQRFVGEAAERACTNPKIHVRPESKYGTRKARKDTVDWIVWDSEAALFIECKAKRLSWAAKAELEDLSALKSDIEQLAGAVVQIYKTIRDYIDGLYPGFPHHRDRKIFPVVATLENWHVFGPRMIEMLEAAVATKLSEAKIPPEYISGMPYSILAVEDIEVGMQIINSIGIRKFIEGKLNDAEMPRWGWRGYITRCFPDYLPPRNLFMEEYEESFSEQSFKE